MNNDGTFVGKREVGGNKTTYYSFRFTDGTVGQPDEMLDIMENARSAWDVNSHGDVCITGSTRAYLYTDYDGLWAIDDMVWGDAVDVTKWKSATITYAEHISAPDATAHGRVCGKAVFSAKIGRTTTTWAEPFVLLPFHPAS